MSINQETNAKETAQPLKEHSPKIVEPAYEDHEQRLIDAIKGIKDYAIFILDANGIIRTWNAGAQRINGYLSEEIIGQHFSIFYPQEAKAKEHPQYELKVAREIGRFEEEGWRLRKNGERFWANVVITAFYDRLGQLTGFSKVTRDLTERKLIEDQLRQSKLEADIAKENYRLLIESVKDYAIIRLDPQGIIRSWNTGAERIMGYRADEVLGQHFSQFYPLDDVENGKCDFELKYAEMETVFEGEGWRIRKDGTKFWANLILTCLRNDQGDLVGFSKITRDITNRKDAELALRESESRYRAMADKVMVRSKQFEEMNKQLVALNKEMESFSYSVSHDLRSPLRSIDGFSQILLEDYQDKLDSEAQNYLDRIRMETMRMAQLIDNMLGLSRLNRAELHKEELDLSKIARETANLLREQEPHRNVVFEIQDKIITNADKSLMRSVLQNLMGNAWKYTSKHSAARIEFGTQQENSKTVYFVKDDGAGFKMQYSNKLFGVFQRLHGVHEFPGSGVGLATVQRIIHRHGGEVWAEAEVEQGATFYFTLGQP